MEKEYWTSLSYRIIYFANAIFGLGLGVGGLAKFVISGGIDMLIGGVICLAYGGIFGWVFFLVISKPIIVLDGNKLFNRSFFLKNRIYKPISDYSVEIINFGNTIILSKSGKKAPISSQHLTRQDAAKLYTHLSKICSNKALQPDSQAATRLGRR